MADSSHWMEKAFAKNAGGLHRATGTPSGKPIPKKKLYRALDSDDTHVQHMAQAAANAEGVRKKRYRE